MRNKPRDVAAVVVTYRPTPSLIRNVRLLAMQLQAVFLVDNTPGSGARLFFRMAQVYPNVRIVRLGLNTGMGAALNIGMQLASDAGFRWVLTLDQDSLLRQGSAGRLRHGACHPATAIVAPAIRDIYTQSLILHQRGNAEPGRHKVAITSGNLVRIAAWQSVGGFDWQMFLDMIDFDFCLRLEQKGWNILHDEHTELLHRWGQARRLNLFGLHALTLRVYPPMRRYFQARNSITLLRRHTAAATAWCIKHLLGLLLVSLKIVILERHSGAAWRLGLKSGWIKPDYTVAPIAPRNGSNITSARKLARAYKRKLDELSTFPTL